MEAQASNTQYIINGVHLTENLLHHKRSDVERILEDKGFKKVAGAANNDSRYCYELPGAAASGRQTVICFDDKGFVLEEDGVQHISDGGVVAA